MKLDRKTLQGIRDEARGMQKLIERISAKGPYCYQWEDLARCYKKLKNAADALNTALARDEGHILRRAEEQAEEDRREYEVERML